MDGRIVHITEKETTYTSNRKLVPIIITLAVFVICVGILGKISEQAALDRVEKAELSGSKQSSVDEDAVYITTSGQKYHRSTCRFVKDKGIAISREEAKELGLVPCSVCKP